NRQNLLPAAGEYSNRFSADNRYCADDSVLAAAWNNPAPSGHLFGVYCARDSDRFDQRPPQRTSAVRLWQQFHSHPAGHGSRGGFAVSVRRKAAADFRGYRFASTTVQGSFACRHRQRGERSEPDSANRNGQAGDIGISGGDERQPTNGG